MRISFNGSWLCLAGLAVVVGACGQSKSLDGEPLTSQEVQEISVSQDFFQVQTVEGQTVWHRKLILGGVLDPSDWKVERSLDGNAWEALGATNEAGEFYDPDQRLGYFRFGGFEVFSGAVEPIRNVVLDGHIYECEVKRLFSGDVLTIRNMTFGNCNMYLQATVIDVQGTLQPYAERNDPLGRHAGEVHISAKRVIGSGLISSRGEQGKNGPKGKHADRSDEATGGTGGRGGNAAHIYLYDGVVVSSSNVNLSALGGAGGRGGEGNTYIVSRAVSGRGGKLADYEGRSEVLGKAPNGATGERGLDGSVITIPTPMQF